jgi:hypothetical protein
MAPNSIKLSFMHVKVKIRNPKEIEIIDVEFYYFD